MSRCRCVINGIQRNDSTESVNLTCQSARTVRLFCSNQFCPLCINTVLAIILLVTSNMATLSFTQHQWLRVLIFLMFPPQKNIIFFMEQIFVDLRFPYSHIYWWHHVGEYLKTVGQWKWSAFGQPLDVLWLLCWQKITMFNFLQCRLHNCTVRNILKPSTSRWKTGMN